MAATITALPTPPSRSDPVNFSTRADAFLLALPTFRSEANTLASEAETDAATAETKATEAAASAASALSYKNAAEAAYDAFDDRWLGAKSSDPIVDNDGGALQAGAVYFNTTATESRVYNGSAWVSPLVSGGTLGATTINGELQVRKSVAGGLLTKLYDISGVGVGGRGSGLSLGGVVTDAGSVVENFGSISGLKINSTQGNSQGFLQFSVNSGSSLIESFRVNYTGNVIIGSTVDRGCKFASIDNIGILSANDGAGSAEINFAQTGSTPSGACKIGVFKTGSQSAYMDFSTSDSGAVTQRMRLTESGDLLNGTTTPTTGFVSKFVRSVTGNFISFGLQNTDSSGGSRYVIGNDAGAARFVVGYTGSAASIGFGAATGYIGTEGSEDWLFQTGGTERGRVKAGGNLLWGTSTDTGEKLQVNGTVKSSGLTLGTSNNDNPSTVSQILVTNGDDIVRKSSLTHLASKMYEASGAFVCRAWVNFNGQGTVAIKASGNVSSITDNGVGDYTINYTTALSDANYVASGFGVANDSANVSGASTVTFAPTGSGTLVPLLKSTTQSRILVGNPFTGAPQDCTDVSFSVIR